MRDFWVFGYGSLMWNPGFAVAERRGAVLHGLHRALCVHSWVHRGTQEEPGLVLGLDRGGSCRGLAMRVGGTERDAVIDYLRGRELVTNVYFETWRPVRLDSGERVEALTYVVDPAHRQYAGRLSDEEIAAIVRRGNGRSGRNADYVLSTLAHLREQGIFDAHLEAIGRLLGADVAASG
ncbi:MAG: gamma-glutamylcyclotransferase [Alphaproteobacteria bacterium]|nr:MAG: gamma-glutamylcyclotransferase [Alphaproteobacteria bacterium]